LFHAAAYEILKISAQPDPTSRVRQVPLDLPPRALDARNGGAASQPGPHPARAITASAFLNGRPAPIAARVHRLFHASVHARDFLATAAQIRVAHVQH